MGHKLNWFSLHSLPPESPQAEDSRGSLRASLRCGACFPEVRPPLGPFQSHPVVKERPDWRLSETSLDTPLLATTAVRSLPGVPTTSLELQPLRKASPCTAVANSSRSRSVLVHDSSADRTTHRHGDPGQCYSRLRHLPEDSDGLPIRPRDTGHESHPDTEYRIECRCRSRVRSCDPRSSRSSWRR